jgi:hypothetical protein
MAVDVLLHISNHHFLDHCQPTAHSSDAPTYRAASEDSLVGIIVVVVVSTETRF